MVLLPQMAEVWLCDPRILRADPRFACAILGLLHKSSDPRFACAILGLLHKSSDPRFVQS